MDGNNDLFGSSSRHRLRMPGAARLEFIGDFLQPVQHQGLFARLRESLRWEQSEIRIAGRMVRIPRLNAWYGDRGSRYRYSGRLFEATPWSAELLQLRDLVERECDAGFNSVLANLYRDGGDSVAWHADDEPELGTDPTIASLSLGASRKFQLKHKSDRSIPRIDLELPDNSLLIMAGSLQHEWIHQLPKTRRPVGARINLTFRRIQSL
ncbi:MAG: alpha-ketoglutarate-dependent dioxygenase AlkB [Gammaproteobacteria bacterium]|nr:alpha-ketoglutarate-dependent dioxygenase AlkB [Gammaproteobacteria bacterium]